MLVYQPIDGFYQFVYKKICLIENLQDQPKILDIFLCVVIVRVTKRPESYHPCMCRALLLLSSLS